MATDQWPSTGDVLPVDRSETYVSGDRLAEEKAGEFTGKFERNESPSNNQTALLCSAA